MKKVLYLFTSLLVFLSCSSSDKKINYNDQQLQIFNHIENKEWLRTAYMGTESIFFYKHYDEPNIDIVDGVANGECLISVVTRNGNKTSQKAYYWLYIKGDKHVFRFLPINPKESVIDGISGTFDGPWTIAIEEDGGIRLSTQDSGYLGIGVKIFSLKKQ